MKAIEVKMSGLKVNYLVQLQSFARKIFSPSKLVSKFFPFRLGDMHDSNLQTFAS